MITAMVIRPDDAPTTMPRAAFKADPHDAEDFDVTAEGLERGKRSRLIRITREALGLSPPEFAARFRIPVGVLRDWEQVRSTAPDFAVAYVRVIAAYPELVAQVVAPPR